VNPERGHWPTQFPFRKGIFGDSVIGSPQSVIFVNVG
jgi:hypothetical protein